METKKEKRNWLFTFGSRVNVLVKELQEHHMRGDVQLGISLLEICNLLQGATIEIDRLQKIIVSQEKEIKDLSMLKEAIKKA
jgi:hypothetical protein